MQRHFFFVSRQRGISFGKISSIDLVIIDLTGRKRYAIEIITGRISSRKHWSKVFSSWNDVKYVVRRTSKRFNRSRVLSRRIDANDTNDTNGIKASLWIFEYKGRSSRFRMKKRSFVFRGDANPLWWKKRGLGGNKKLGGLSDLESIVSSKESTTNGYPVSRVEKQRRSFVIIASSGVGS